MTQTTELADFVALLGSQWRQAFTVTNAGVPVDLTGLAWEFVIRPVGSNATTPAPISVTTSSTEQGQIIVDALAGSITAIVTPAATRLLGPGDWEHALWSNPHTTTDTCWCAGIFRVQSVAQP